MQWALSYGRPCYTLLTLPNNYWANGEQKCPIQGKPYRVPVSNNSLASFPGSRPHALPNEDVNSNPIIPCHCHVSSVMMGFPPWQISKIPMLPNQKMHLGESTQVIFQGSHGTMRWHCVNTNSGRKVHHFYTVLAFIHYAIQMTQKQTLTTKGLRNNS